MTKQYLCLTGREPELSTAELERVYGANQITPSDGFVWLDSLPDINRLGGCPKTAELISRDNKVSLSKLQPLLEKSLLGVLDKDKKAKFGISSFINDLSLNELNRLGLKITKSMRAKGYRLRHIPNKALELNAGQVWHNRLDRQPNVELLLLGKLSNLVVARTIGVQDIESYTLRDRSKPFADSRSGMLPPKLARLMMNLAVGQKQDLTVVDPFCGSGTVLMEALLSGFAVAGSDISQAMVGGTKQNIEWLGQKYNLDLDEVKISLDDARTVKLPPNPAIVSETYLGPPLTSLPYDMSGLVAEVNQLIYGALANFSKQLPSGAVLTFAVPAWFNSKTSRYHHLPLVDELDSLGYNRLDLKHTAYDKLIYHRPDQIVARQILALEKK